MAQVQIFFVVLHYLATCPKDRYICIKIVIPNWYKSNVLWVQQALKLPYIANCSRWKSFAVAEFKYILLETFAVGPSRATNFQTYYQKEIISLEKFHGYQIIHENRETFTPQTICNIQYKVLFLVKLTYSYTFFINSFRGTKV